MNWLRNSIYWGLGLLVLAIVLGFVQSEQRKMTCKGISIDIDHNYSGNQFISEDGIRELIRDLGYHDSSLLSDIDIQQLEARLNNNPSILRAEAYLSIPGKLMVDIDQRKPVIRVFSQDGSSYYIDEGGWLMPLSGAYTSRILVANGFIMAPYGPSSQVNLSLPVENDSVEVNNLLRDLYQVAMAVQNDPFWEAQINQVYHNDNGDLELIPRVGNHRIVIGDAENLDEKLHKLMIFYKKGLSKTGWNEYSVINLKFHNQVVCTKK